jgi:hypothetical protein
VVCVAAPTSSTLRTGRDSSPHPLLA